MQFQYTYLQPMAEMNRFQVGDSLYNDLVMHVNNVDYTNCNTTTTVVTYSDRNFVFTFNQSGPFHIISGIREKCLKNETLIVVVMVDRSSDHYSNSKQTTSDSPPPTPSYPTSLPTNSIVISPALAPAGLESPRSSSSSSPSPVSFAIFIVSIRALLISRFS
ncbi:hypothetical protein MKX01_014066 [Papaver californicum]|nr:hypothetical protein MKX01_014066 [Papaver californicum]